MSDTNQVSHPVVTGQQGWLPAAVVTVILVLTLWYFVGTPLEQAGNLLGSVALGLLLVCGVLLVIAGRCTGPYGLLMVTLVGAALVIPVYSAIRANYYYGQPLIYGLLAERHWWGLAFGPLVYHLVVTGTLQAGKLVACLKALAWGSLACYLATVCLYLFGGEELRAYFELTAISDTGHRGLRTNLPVFPIMFGAAYYLALASKERAVANILKSGLFVFYVFFIARGRVDMMCMAVAILYAICTSGLLARWRTLVAIAVFYTVLGSLIPQYAGDDELQDDSGSNILVRTYLDIMALLAGETATDHGLNARRMSLAIVGSRLADSPATLVLGTGRVSNNWLGGFSGVLDTWFYPRELWMVGAVFVYGLLGYLVVTAGSLLLALKVLWRTAATTDIGLAACRWVLVFWVCKFIGGVPLLFPMQFFLILFICFALQREALPRSLQ